MSVSLPNIRWKQDPAYQPQILSPNRIRTGLLMDQQNLPCIKDQALHAAAAKIDIPARGTPFPPAHLEESP
jgi:hypothetical protein